MPKRVLLASLFHETHTFIPTMTMLGDFALRRGAELWRADGDVSTLAGSLAVAQECGWEVVPVIDLNGGASGMVADAVVDLFWETFRDVALRELPRGIDGVCLNMHGAMVSQSQRDVEGELLRRIRALDGFADLPICGVLDLHGNITAAMAQHSNGLIAYRHNPHTDGKQAAIDGARLLDRLMHSGEQAVTVWEHPPLMLPPTATGTAFEPMRTLEAQARAIEIAHPSILAVNVFAGFAYADMPEAGVGFTAVTIGDPDEARAALRELSATALAHKHFAAPDGITLDEALDRLAMHHSGPVVLIEPADNIGGGTAGDLTLVLGGLLERGIQNTGVIINDPAAVQQLTQLPVGAQVRLPIGGWSGGGSQPIVLDVEILSTSNGRFTVEDRHSHMAVNGIDIAMGPCAVVRSAGVTILLTSRATPPFDLAQWRSQGYDPEAFAVIGVKAAVAHRQAYDPIAAASYVLNTPGPCAPDLRTLPYQHVTRPVYPLDALA